MHACKHTQVSARWEEQRPPASSAVAELFDRKAANSSMHQLLHDAGTRSKTLKPRELLALIDSVATQK